MSIKQKILEHNKLNNFKYLDEGHKYFVNDEEFLSVTTKKAKFFPFKKMQIAREVGLKNWTTEQEVISEWEQLAINGSNIHLLAEKYCNNELKKEERKYILNVIKYFEDNPQFEIIASEIKVFCKKFKIAGTIDLIVKDTQTNKLYTIDWKTSKKDIKKEDIYSFAKPPFNHLPNNKFYQYSLQLWAYNLILSYEYNIEIYDSIIIHLKNDLKTYQEITPITLLEEAKVLLEN